MYEIKDYKSKGNVSYASCHKSDSNGTCSHKSRSLSISVVPSLSKVIVVISCKIE